jgi:hypothetical protein
VVNDDDKEEEVASSIRSLIMPPPVGNINDEEDDGDDDDPRLRRPRVLSVLTTPYNNNHKHRRSVRSVSNVKKWQNIYRASLSVRTKDKRQKEIKDDDDDPA